MKEEEEEGKKDNKGINFVIVAFLPFCRFS